MSFLITPRRFSDESKRGYLFRLASANVLPLKLVEQIAFATSPTAGAFAGGAADQVSLAVDAARCCPGCLGAAAYWRRHWLIPFADACPIHRTWLIDVCDQCGSGIKWSRYCLSHCDCGRLLARSATSEAPESVVALSADLIDIGNGRPASRLLAGRQLSLSQAVRLVRFIGAYGAIGARAPQKIMRVDRMALSWQLSSYAAEVLAHWPRGFHWHLSKCAQRGAREDSAGSLSRAFLGIYHALYRGLADPQFSFLREAFESFVRDRWPGSLARRNRRLSERTREDSAWISASSAALQLGVSRARLVALIGTGEIVGLVRTTRSGRQFWTVLRESVLRVTLQEVCTLEQAAARLGLRRSRLKRLLGPLSLIGRDREPGGAWRVDGGLVSRLEQVVRAATTVDAATSSQFALGSALRFGAIADEALSALLLALAEGKLRPSGRIGGLRGLPSLVLPRAWLNESKASGDSLNRFGLSGPDAARALRIKQEVLYFLIRKGLLQADRVAGTRRAEWRVREENLNEFRRRFVFARDVAQARGSSARAVARHLAAVGRHPCSGPSVDGGRQLIYRRVDVEASELSLGGVPIAMQRRQAGEVL